MQFPCTQLSLLYVGLVECWHGVSLAACKPSFGLLA